MMLPTIAPLLDIFRRLTAGRPDRRTYGIYDERGDYVGTIELYDLRGHEATLGIIIGERSHWV